MDKIKNSLHMFLIIFFYSLILSRFLNYLPAPEIIQDFLAYYLPFQNYFLFIFNYQEILIPAALLSIFGFLILFFRFPQALFKSSSWQLKFWPNLVIFPFIILLSLFLDFNPFLTLLAVFSIPLFIFSKKRIYLLAIALILPFASDIVDFLAVLIWMVLIFKSFKILKKSSGKEALIFIYILSLIPQIFATFCPMYINFHSGKKVSKGMAYFFCQSPSNSHIFATIPNCPTFKPTNFKEFQKCKSGKILEFDADLKKIKEHNFFSDEFFGRLEGMICLPDSLIIGVTNLQKGERFYNSNGLKYNLGPNSKAKILRAKDQLGGNGAIYDPNAHALFTFSEDARKVQRLDIKTGLWDLEIGKYWDVGPLIVGVDGHHFARKTMFAGEFIGGNRTIEFSSENFEIKNYYPSPDGAVLGVTADNKLDRIIISGFWGISIIDLKTKKVIKKIRTGFLPRAAVIDKKNDLVFVGSTFDGKIRIFHRETYKHLKTLPVGYGVRYLLVDKDSKYLLYANKKGTYSWEIPSNLF